MQAIPGFSFSCLFQKHCKCKRIGLKFKQYCGNGAPSLNVYILNIILM